MYSIASHVTKVLHRIEDHNTSPAPAAIPSRATTTLTKLPDANATLVAALPVWLVPPDVPDVDACALEALEREASLEEWAEADETDETAEDTLWRTDDALEAAEDTLEAAEVAAAEALDAAEEAPELALTRSLCASGMTHGGWEQGRARTCGALGGLDGLRGGDVRGAVRLNARERAGLEGGGGADAGEVRAMRALAWLSPLSEGRERSVQAGAARGGRCGFRAGDDARADA